ncbi:type II toxin-antitoxin system YafO family toxin [Vibrio sp. 10N.222.54.A1]|jgi:hypothetical protein|uniref:type II toxin-antitoxin system YafO family toxin n=1 Tax=Vibrio TaxID=662 RepID=UPI000153020B|nr:hypothetical protein VSWAT3_21900 [Vibrionales bacterium SWAT-3]CAK2899915.1 conserved hypothetical protein [Vibrio crassostreae]
MHQISFSPRFEKEVESLGHSLDAVKVHLELHLDAIGTGEMPVPYLGKTDAFHFPQAVVDADLSKIHVFDPTCTNFTKADQDSWKRATNLRGRTSDTYLVYTKDYFNEHHCYFVGMISPAHTKCDVRKSGMSWFGPLVDEANKFNGIQ